LEEPTAEGYSEMVKVPPEPSVKFGVRGNDPGAGLCRASCPEPVRISKDFEILGGGDI
jgi:hypothetical protein